MATASWNDVVIANSDDLVEVEGNLYFPQDGVDYSHLAPSEHTSHCPWKGTASYYHVEVDGQRNENAAWYYPDPKPEAAQIKNRIAFWKGVQVKA